MVLDALIIAASLLALELILLWSLNFFRKDNHPFLGSVEAFAYFLIPTAFFFDIILSFGISPNGSLAKAFETVLGLEIIWIVLSLFKALVMTWAREHHWETKVPGLFLDLVRIIMAVFGAVIVTAYVWNYDATKFIATLGVGSLVVGLALQETLGNLFAGISLLFEQPFKVGDWIKVGDLVGEVVGTNWRSVRLRSRDMTMIVVPNSVLGRERIENFSQPTPVVGVLAHIGFSYSDPPNKVKKILSQVVLETPNILHEPKLRIRTKSFADSSVTYELRYFINDYAVMPDIDEDLKTRIWYAARRFGLTIPFPMRVVHKTEMPAPAKVDAHEEISKALKAVDLFAPLNSDEFVSLARDVMVLDFGNNERVFEQGESGDSLYIVKRGAAIVSVKDERGVERDVAHLGAGDFFGEMALLTGEPRAASVRAEGDLTLLVIYKEALQEAFKTRPALAGMIAEIAEARRVGLKEVRDSANSVDETQQKVKERAGVLVGRIKSFFGIK